MTTEWSVVAAAEHFALDARNTGELSFTVSNPGPADDTVVFDVVPGDGTARSWFDVPEPQRRVRAGAAVSYLVKLNVPGGTAPRRYDMTGLAYSADTAPEESSRSSGRVTYDVRAQEKKPSRWPWIAAAVALVLIVGGVTTFLLTRPKATPPPPPPAPADLVVEMETLAATATVNSPAKTDAKIQTQNAADLTGITLTWSGGSQAFFTGKAIGDQVSFPVAVPADGDYAFSQIRTTAPDYANTVWQVDGRAIGGNFAGFSAKVLVTPWQTVGTVHLTKGTHAFTITVTGKLQSTTSYFAGVDAIRLQQIS
ncbi:hypothetical protein [Hamadaea tsunoensis]|uniref:hypothetical protein n=1 Tax=Hamadaea tsunoensis TaxID=53368 RepID=UPI00040ABEAA|nr:hypothetical protein [Hamadaea tsunoensis]